jgi:hypothetical protein
MLREELLGIRPRDPVAACGSAAGERAAHCCFYPHATSSRVERLRCRVLVEYPQVEAVVRTSPREFAGRFGQQPGADAVPLERCAHMQVVDERSPFRIAIRHHVNEADHITGHLGHDGVRIRSRVSEAVSPNGLTVGGDVAVEKGIQVGAPVVATPAVGVEPGDRVDIGCGRAPVSGQDGSRRPCIVIAWHLPGALSSSVMR